MVCFVCLGNTYGGFLSVFFSEPQQRGVTVPSKESYGVVSNKDEEGILKQNKTTFPLQGRF